VTLASSPGEYESLSVRKTTGVSTFSVGSVDVVMAVDVYVVEDELSSHPKRRETKIENNNTVIKFSKNRYFDTVLPPHEKVVIRIKKAD
jgi:hypothetical protein